MKLYNDFKSFLNKILGQGLSSKRTVGFGCFILLAACVTVHLSGGVTVAEFIWWGLISLIVACFGLNTFISSKSMSVKSKVAGGLIDQQVDDDTADDVKDVLNSNKP